MMTRYGSDLEANVRYLKRPVAVSVKSDEATKRVTMPGSKKKKNMWKRQVPAQLISTLSRSTNNRINEGMKEGERDARGRMQWRNSMSQIQERTWDTADRRCGRAFQTHEAFDIG